MINNHKPNERYDEQRHGGLDKWSKGNPKQRGHYTVICNNRNRYWVKYDWFFNGTNWVTPANNLAYSVILYLEDSRRE